MTPARREQTLFSADELTGELNPPTETTWSVPELYDTLSEVIEEHFGSRTWVTGELRSLNRSNKGHRYFELIEPGSEGDYNAPRLKVTLFAGNRKRVNATLNETGSAVRIEEGTVLRICGDLRTYAARSTLQLVMTGIDPSYTLGVVSQRREAVLAALRAEDLIGVNAKLAVPYPSMHLALITSTRSAAAADTLHELERAGIGFHLVTLDARTQGAEAESTLVAALRTAEELSVDVVLLVRGGGSASDLSVFDSELLARTIAGLEVPVFTGVGHETDRSVADEVAHTAYKTPTAAAAAIVAMATDARRSLEQVAASVSTAALGTTMRAERDLRAAARSSAFACRQHLEREDKLLSARLERIGAAAPLALGRLDVRVDQLARRTTSAVEPSLDRATTRLESLAALTSARDPRKMMELGWSVSHDVDGNLVRSITDVAPGDDVLTTVADGTFTSTVTTVSAKGDPQ
jgi:exodeoxyribonuclease VII large subunit